MRTKIFIIISLSLFFQNCFSQSANNAKSEANPGKIVLNAFIPEKSRIPEHSKELMLSKLHQIATQNGVSSDNASNPDFVITANANTLSSEMLSESLQYYINLEVTIYIYNARDNKMFSTKTITCKGVANTEIKAYKEAIKKINPTSADISAFISQSKNKIIQYYNSICQTTISNSKTLSGQNKYEEAIANLYSLPDQVSCHQTVQGEIIDTYKKYQNYICSKKIQSAKTEMASLNWNTALDILSSIDPQSSCIKDAEVIVNKCLKELTDKEKKEFQMKKEENNNAIMLENKRIEASKQIAIAYYNSFPKTINYNNILLY